MQLTKTRVWLLENVRNRSGLSLLCVKKILCFSVEPDQRRGLSRHGSVEIFDGAYNLTVPNKLARHSSTSKLEEIHSDHIKIVGELEDNQQSVTSEVQTSVTAGTEHEVKVNNESSCVQKTCEENSFSSTTTSSQRSEMHESVTSCQQTSYEEMRQTNFQVKTIK